MIYPKNMEHLVCKIDRTHTHPVVTFVTYQIWDQFP
jgi:hypothetical protein